MYVDYVVNFRNSSPSKFLRRSVRAVTAFITDIVPTKEMLFAPSVEELIIQLNEHFGLLSVVSHIVD
jgi:hypothetical protein